MRVKRQVRSRRCQVGMRDDGMWRRVNEAEPGIVDELC